MQKSRFRLSTRLTLAVGVLLVIFLSRVLWLNQLEFNHDEIWNAWSTVGTPAAVLERVPYDWTPLHFLFVWAWQSVAGSHPVVLRLSSVLIFMLGCAFTYRLLWRITQREAAAWGALLVYAALGFAVFLSTYFRAYVLMLALMPGVLWCVIAYFERPAGWRLLLAAVGMAAMFYTNLTAAVAFGAMGLYTLLVYPRQLWRWLPIGLVAGLLALPEIIDKANLAGSRPNAIPEMQRALPEAMLRLFEDYAGVAFPLWVIGMGIVISLILYHERPFRPRTLALLLWVFALPMLVYLLDAALGFFSAAYSWWVLVGIALLMGVGFGYLPRIAQAIAGVLLLAAMFVPFDHEDYGFATLPFEAQMRELRQHYRPGDVLYVDANCDCGSPMAWDYYQGVYFPQGLQWATEPATHRRVWHVRADGWHDEAALNQLRETHLPAKFFGTWDFLFQLHVAPPDADGILFENGMRLHGAVLLDASGNPDVAPVVRPEGGELTVRLWWSTDAPLTADYSVALQVLSADGSLIAQKDGAPQLKHLQPNLTDALPQQTSQWQNTRYYIEDRALTLPNPMPVGAYDIMLSVYQWWDGVRLDAPGVDANTLLNIGTLHIMSW